MSLEYFEKITLFGNELIDFNNLGEMIFRFGIDLIAVFVIIRLIYYPIYKDRNYLFTGFVINISVFLICFILSSIKIKIGFAFGLFAVFSILRYRTEQIPIRNMTYLFVSIMVAVINSLSAKKISYAEVVFANTAIAMIILLFEKRLIRQDEVVRISRYEKLDLIKPENYDKLLSDLKERVGLDVSHVEVERVNFLNDTARLKVSYKKANKPEYYKKEKGGA